MDFSYLNSISGGDKDFIAEFVSTIEKTTLPLMDEIVKEIESGNLQQVGEAAHQVKPTIKMLGLESFDLIEAMNKTPETATKEKALAVKADLEAAIQELKTNHM